MRCGAANDDMPLFVLVGDKQDADEEEAAAAAADDDDDSAPPDAMVIRDDNDDDVAEDCFLGERLFPNSMLLL